CARDRGVIIRYFDLW
nr:immunoglobulin heavy chain junction region [Macaca mulatta]